ncbi:glycosyltransferase family A protein [Rubellicoccus peritrichatus]|uniref:Glycosyltransferase family A protein n=1 Tax=Rubellicoccus peritrichatus TaxID=3080537 RepID=A0AAQ3QSN0_9BACT|nr:glycosyltransferase family A protein [Puniceicoccus sp. CR14]WOO42683.1 glycosyltransferase family A protein [Puniceicoccus sp. CR14]
MKALPITVIIPAHQAEKYLQETIESILAQTTRPSEILVVDDGSTDQTNQIASSYTEVTVITHPTNLGLSNTLNTGIANAGQPWIAFLDADDLWLEDKLRQQWTQLQAPSVDQENTMVFTQIEQFMSPDLSPDQQLPLNEKHRIMKGIFKGTLLLHKKVFEKVGLFDPELTIGDFVDWYARSRENHVAEIMIPEVLTRRRIHQTNMGRVLSNQNGQLAKVMLNSIKRRKQRASAS